MSLSWLQVGQALTKPLLSSPREDHQNDLLGSLDSRVAGALRARGHCRTSDRRSGGTNRRLELGPGWSWKWWQQADLMTG